MSLTNNNNNTYSISDRIIVLDKQSVSDCMWDFIITREVFFSISQLHTSLILTDMKLLKHFSVKIYMFAFLFKVKT